MLDLLVLAAAGVLQETPPPRILIPTNREPRVAGPTPVEFRTLSQPHRNMDLRMFPDIAVKNLRIDGDTLYVLVANEGRGRAKGPIRVTATAETGGLRAAAAPVRLASLRSGESRWVPLRNFGVKSADAAARGPVFAIADASLISAEANLPPPSAALDRTGRGCDPARCIREINVSNNGMRAPGAAIARGRP